MGHSFDHWYVIVKSEYPCISHTILVIPCVWIHVFTSNYLLFRSPMRIICSPWSINFAILVLRFIHNWSLGSFWIFMIVRYYSCWVYALPALALSVDKYAAKILVLILFFPLRNIHDHQPTFLNSWPVVLLCMIFHIPPWQLCLCFEMVHWRWWLGYTLY